MSENKIDVICYICEKTFTIPVSRFNPDNEYDPTDWECPECIKAQDEALDKEIDLL